MNTVTTRTTHPLALPFVVDATGAGGFVAVDCDAVGRALRRFFAAAVFFLTIVHLTKSNIYASVINPCRRRRRRRQW